MRILVAEDDRVTRMMLVRQLQAWGHHVAEEQDGQAALERFTGGEYELVITDWEMPRMSGVELVTHVRQMTRPGYTYIILLTSRSDKQDVVRGIEAGADDYVAKPFDRDELRVRLLAGERIIRLEAALSRQNAQLRDANERIHHGLRAAARVQQSMLPQHNIDTSRVRTAWKYVPTDELAGDAIGLHLIEDRYLIAYVLDVSGHGVPAALLSVSAMHALAPEPEEASLLRVLQSDADLGTIQHPAKVAAELNRRFRAGENDGRYLTMMLTVLDTHSGKLFLTSAGHPPPLVIRQNGSIATPDAGGLPIAVMDGADYDEGQIRLQPGDRISLFSDGVIEQLDTSGQHQFGAERLLRSLVDRSQADLSAATEGAVTDLATWAGSDSFTDDVSIAMLEWLG